MSSLFAIGPVDGRYQKKTESLQAYYSEYGLIKYRVLVEIRYLQALHRLGLPQMQTVSSDQMDKLDGIIDGFEKADAEAIKEIERTTNHDVKAVEYYLKDKLSGLGLDSILEFVHFGLTSQDINNTAVPLSLKDGLEQVVVPSLNSLKDHLSQLSEDWRYIPMLARTHGQPASPTLLGKEFAVWVSRFHEQLRQLQELPIPAKFGGATGNLNAHYLAFPDYNWDAFAGEFTASLGLKRSYPTTQIEHYDNLGAIFHVLQRINTILIDLCRDVWTYISMEYFRQRTIAGEVGSSAMPHKVNPIDFENAEGNLGIANALLGHLAEKLPVSRLQRDLTDSTVLRNIGVPLAHQFIAIKAIEKGLGKLLLNEEKLASDLDANWLVTAEAIQNVLRREGYPKPYEALKALTRGKTEIDQATMHHFIDDLEVSEVVKAELKQISPANYVGRWI
ncbi:MAG: adenylosuccinate lyase [Bacteroidota bacterium]